MAQSKSVDRAVNATRMGIPEGTMSDSDFKQSLLNSIGLFRNVDPDSISDLLQRCGRIDVETGQVLLSPEKDNHCVYIVLSGELQVHLGTLESTKVADLGPGSCAGEMSLIEGKDPSAYVVATEACHLMVISPSLLWQMVERSHAFSKNLLVVLSERVRSDNEFIASRLGVLKEAERHATTDALTGLGNRRWMQDMFERELKRAEHSRKSVCLMMIDIDKFKYVNDQYGHIAGDQILAIVAQSLREHLRPTDMIARFGGDEFAVLLPDTTLPRALETAERLRMQVSEASPAALTQPITISAGVGHALPGDYLDELVHRADSAMYAAKAAGRNRVVQAVTE